MTRLIQIIHPKLGRKIAKVDDKDGILLSGHTSVFGLANTVLRTGASLLSEIESSLSEERFNYDALYNGTSDWHLLPAYDHPGEPTRCLVTGTGLTHKASVDNRQAMHAQESNEAPVTDSMRMYQWGLEGGKPKSGTFGVSPEWFYKGCGTVLRAHGEPLDVPPYAGDGGEEPEIAGAYIIAPNGTPRRIGMVTSNEFSDHVTEKKNCLYLAPSKLRVCSLGPELIIDPDFNNVSGTVSIERNGKPLWSRAIATGEKNMSHSLANMEHHHFKYEFHRRPGDAHIHFFGADAFSFGEGVSLEDGDVMVVEWDGFGRSLRNPLRVSKEKNTFVRVDPL